MKALKTLLAALAVIAGFTGVALAQDHGGSTPARQQSWSFAGVFGTYDQNQLQRGFQIFQNVCSSCHSARLLAFRNLSEDGGPGFSEEQVKLLASTYIVQDLEAEDGERTATSSDHWPAPFLTEREARDANNGALPPDFSVLAKARTIQQPFPFWVFNYFTAYQEGGPDYIYSLLTSYHEAPAGVEVPAGQYYNSFMGGMLSMSPPLTEELVTYEGEGVPMTVEQYSRDVAAFMMWLADPHLTERKALGFKVLAFLLVFVVLMYLTKRKLWEKVEH
jgi:ubiquinol-cytochrome c reductase cytochrome c1 subunit